MRGGRRSDALIQLIARGTNCPQTIETLPEIRDAGTNCSIVEAPWLAAYPPNSVAKVHPGKAPCLNQKAHSRANISIAAPRPSSHNDQDYAESRLAVPAHTARRPLEIR